MTANLNFLDNWQGEAATVSVNGKVIWMKSVRASNTGVNICGGTSTEAAFNVPVVAETADDNSNLVVTFQSTLEGDPCLKSLGIDNVSIYVR